MKVRGTETNTFEVMLKVWGADFPSFIDPVRVSVAFGGDGASVLLDVRGPLHGVTVQEVE